MTPRQYRHAVGVLRSRTSLHEGDIHSLAIDIWNPRLSDRLNVRRCRARVFNHIRNLLV